MLTIPPPELTVQQQMELNAKQQKDSADDAFRRSARNVALSTASYARKDIEDIKSMLKSADEIYTWLTSIL